WSHRLSKPRTPGNWESTTRPWHVCSWKVRRAAINEPRSRRDIQARSLQRVHTAACPVLAAWSTDPCRAKTKGPTPQRITLPVPPRVGGVQRLAEGVANCVVLLWGIWQHGYGGGYIILKSCVRPYRRRSPRHATIRFEPAPRAGVSGFRLLRLAHGRRPSTPGYERTI